MLDRIQSCLTNRLDPSAGAHKWIAGIVGDRPSQYAKSPSLWNRAFRSCELDGIFLPFDVEASNLPSLLEVLRQTQGVIGFSVTVPYKVEVMRFLDDIDQKAARIGAVNTVARTQEGKLVGYNTDGQGFMDMLTKPLPDQERPFFENMEGLYALLIGAGGAARSVAFFLAEALGDRGRLIITNRDANKGQGLANALRQAGFSNLDYLAETDIGAVARTLDVVINATTKGQSGIRRLAGKKITCLEPYCALAPAKPAELNEDSCPTEAEFYNSWYQRSHTDIEVNLRTANEILAMTPMETAFVDLIYAPLETRMLTMARWNGHRVLNGKEMNVRQAADAFVNRVMGSHLTAMGWDLGSTYRRVSEIMSQIW